MSLATKYRPQTFDDVTEQMSVKIILQQQLRSGEIQHAYLFTGGAGTGKTTCARIFANEINKGQGNPLELDAASNNSVDDIRTIIQQAKVQSMDSEYRIFILDEVHALSNNAWQALLKLLEEPPKKAIFIMCTTNPEKIPRTIISRVQRFDFKRISLTGIKNRLEDICDAENREADAEIIKYDAYSLYYIAKLAEGGMRDAITLLDKCIAYSKELTVEHAVTALGTVDYEVFFELADHLACNNSKGVIQVVENVYSDGKDIKQFIKDFMGFLLDINKYDILHSFDYLQLPSTYETALQNYAGGWYNCCRELLPIIVKLNADLKWDTQPKITIEARLLQYRSEQSEIIFAG